MNGDCSEKTWVIPVLNSTRRTARNTLGVEMERSNVHSSWRRECNIGTCCVLVPPET